MSDVVSDIGPWLSEARRGSREALGEALEACRAYLLLIANREVDPALQANGSPSDLVQQTFLEAQCDFAHFHGESAEEFRAWLRQLLLHNVANFTRSYRDVAKRQVGKEVGLEQETPSGGRRVDLAAETPSPSAHAMANEEADALQQALARLPEDYRLIIVWRYQEGLPFAEIAERMQRSENAVRKLWFRAIERLQSELDTNQ